MRLLSTSALHVSSFLTLPSLILAAASFDCSDIVKDKIRFNLKPLGGPHVVHWIEDEELIIHNHTYTIDICQPLKRTKGVPTDQECPLGSRGIFVPPSQAFTFAPLEVSELTPIS